MQNLKRPNTNKKEILYTLYTYKTERYFFSCEERDEEPIPKNCHRRQCSDTKRNSAL